MSNGRKTGGESTPPAGKKGGFRFAQPILLSYHQHPVSGILDVVTAPFYNQWAWG
jgi:hypothetical protein